MEQPVQTRLVDSLLVPECVYRPGSFTGLMTLYESNFIKLARLMNGIAERVPAKIEPAVSITSRDCDLHLRPVSTERYTTTVKLTYWFDHLSGERVADPDLMVRIYHDARLAEAVRGAEAHHHHKLQELAAHESAGAHSLELDRRWRNNIMLNKWLDYLLDMGHTFG